MTVIKYSSKCRICSTLRSLDEHLFEAGKVCELLGNKSRYEGDEGLQVASLTTVGTWLTLAANLEKVDVNVWKFQELSGAMFCEPIADELDANSSHQSAYSTAFTRFIFAASALEEAYRFVDRNYYPLASTSGRKGKWKLAMRAAWLIDQLQDAIWPMHFQHLSESFSRLCERVRSRGGMKFSMDHTTPGDASYALHLVRNLRNAIAHGAFLPGEHPDYSADEQEARDKLRILNAGTLMCALYVQSFVAAFNTGFEADFYSYLRQGAEESQFSKDQYAADKARAFLSNCTPDYLRTLHLQGEFSIHQYG